MRAHDDANNHRGDWNEAACNQMADAFQRAAREQDGEAFPEAWFNRGMAYERCHMTDQATQAFNRSIEVTRSHHYCRSEVQLGVYLYRAGQRDQALQKFLEAANADAHCVEGHTDLAMMLRECGAPANPTGLPGQVDVDPGPGQQFVDDYSSAILRARDALANDDSFVPALNQLALTYLAMAGSDVRSPRLMLAGFVCEQAIGMSNGREDLSAELRTYAADAHNTYGLILMRTGNITQALRHFEQAFNANPDMFEAYMNYGSINLSFRGYADARRAFDRAVQLRANSYDAHIGLGVTLRGLEDYPGAEREYEAARHLDENRPDAYFNLGALYQYYMPGEGTSSLERSITYFEQYLTKIGTTPAVTETRRTVERRVRLIRQSIDFIHQNAAANTPDPNAGGGAAAPSPDATPPAPAPGGGVMPVLVPAAPPGNGH